MLFVIITDLANANLYFSYYYFLRGIFMQTYIHTCQNCGDTKEIYLLPDEKPEDLSGCVCDRTVEKKSKKISDDSLLKKFAKFEN